MALRTYHDFTRAIIETLEVLEIPYAIGGSFASSAYGEARPSIDIDISVVLPNERIERFVQAIQSLGYYVTWDSILDAMIWKTPFNVIDAQSGYKADLFLVEPTPLEKTILERSRRVIYDRASGASAFLYSPEDVIIYKLKYYMRGQMQKHPRDIMAMLVVQGDALDYDYIARWAEEIGALEIWNELLVEYRRRIGQDLK